MTEVAEARRAIEKPLKPLSDLWFSRCPGPTASGLAYKLGWLAGEFAPDGINVAALQDGKRNLTRHHYDHQLPGLFREGGNVPALAARAQGAPSKLIGLTWIDEWQVILVRPDSGITAPEHLKGVRIALPAYADTRGSSISRAMTLHGFKGVLSLAGLGFDDVQLVEVPLDRPQGSKMLDGPQSLWSGLNFLAEGKVDAVYVKGASAVDAARRVGAVVGIDLDQFQDRRTRVNNGTPRPITVHENLLNDHFDIVVRALAQTLRAADWATTNLVGVQNILQAETRSGPEGVATAYRNGFHLSLHPDLSEERLEYLRLQKNFLLVHGFLESDIDLDQWVDPRPLDAARALLAARTSP